MKLHNAIILKILTAELETEKNSVWTNLNDTNDIIIVKSHEFENSITSCKQKRLSPNSDNRKTHAYQLVDL